MTADQLIALNHEIAALVRAGVPLDLGLQAVGGSVQSVLGRVSRNIAERIQRGQSLPDSLEGAIPGLPRVYQAAVEAGLKSGELPRVLELLSKSMQQGLDLRQRIEFAFLYPLLICLLAYSLIATCVIESAEHWAEIWGEPDLEKSTLLLTYRLICLNWPYWIWIFPTLIALLVIGWVTFARRSLLPNRRPSLLLRLIPGLSGVIKAWHWSAFSETAAMLIEHRVPLPTALRLAGATTGNPQIDSQMSTLASELEQGRSAGEALMTQRALPPFLKWALCQSSQPTTLLSSLRQAAEIHNQHAIRRCDAIKMWLPLFLIFVIGGGAVLIYALTIVIPILGMAQEISREGNGAF